MDALAVVKNNTGKALAAWIDKQVNRINTVHGVNENSPNFVELDNLAPSKVKCADTDIISGMVMCGRIRQRKTDIRVRDWCK